MGLSYSSAYIPDGLGLNRSDAIIIGTVSATYASAGAGVASTVAVAWTEPVPTTYCAVMSPVEDCTYYLTSKTTLGFTLNVLPRLAASSLAGGTVRLMILS